MVELVSPKFAIPENQAAPEIAHKAEKSGPNRTTRTNKRNAIPRGKSQSAIHKETSTCARNTINYPHYNVGKC